MNTGNNSRIYTVSELNHLIRQDLEGSFSDIWLEGEISNFFYHNSRHMYFDLKDEASKVKVVMFYQNNRKLVFDMEEGLHIQVNGYVSVYEKRGEYQIIALDARPVGKGALILAFEQLKEKLSKKGFFDSDRKRRIPLLPEKIGIATSIDGAVLKDMVSVLKKRFPNFHLIVRNVNVGGMTAAAELCQAIDDLCQYGVDVIIIARGGGSLEDLWGFNSEELACSIYECQVPVISAVGHQTDFTISDFVADLRAATPSVAAENVILDKEKISRDIKSIRSALMERSMGLVQNNRRYLSSLIDRKYFTRPQTLLGTRYQDAGIFHRELKDNISSVLNLKRQALSQKTSRIVPDRIRSRIVSSRLALKNSSLRWRNSIISNIGDKKKTAGFMLESLEKNSPANIIKRGFGVIYDSGMKISLSSSDMVASGEDINIQLKDGRIRAKVLEILKNKLFKSGK
jgi:exodeoxyribonuclease VII large subunit